MIRSLKETINLKKLILKDLQHKAIEDPVIANEMLLDEKPQIENNPQSIESESVDIELIKQSSYEEGYMNAKNELQPLLDQSMKDLEFGTSLIEKLKSVNLNDQATKHLFELTITILDQITKKLFLTLPSSFSKALTNQLMELIKNNYKEGKVEITIHPTKLKICKNIIKLNDWPQYLSNSIVIIENPKIHESSCTVKWYDTQLQYNPDAIFKQIDNLLQNLIQRA